MGKKKIEEWILSKTSARFIYLEKLLTFSLWLFMYVNNMCVCVGCGRRKFYRVELELVQWKYVENDGNIVWDNKVDRWYWGETEKKECVMTDLCEDFHPAHSLIEFHGSPLRRTLSTLMSTNTNFPAIKLNRSNPNPNVVGGILIFLCLRFYA
jgi:hypothetical protein